jgi:hypothetical protein
LAAECLLIAISITIGRNGKQRGEPFGLIPDNMADRSVTAESYPGPLGDFCLGGFHLGGFPGTPPDVVPDPYPPPSPEPDGPGFPEPDPDPAPLDPEPKPVPVNYSN